MPNPVLVDRRTGDRVRPSVVDETTGEAIEVRHLALNRR